MPQRDLGEHWKLTWRQRSFKVNRLKRNRQLYATPLPELQKALGCKPGEAVSSSQVVLRLSKCSGFMVPMREKVPGRPELHPEQNWSMLVVFCMEILMSTATRRLWATSAHTSTTSWLLAVNKMKGGSWLWKASMADSVFHHGNAKTIITVGSEFEKRWTFPSLWTISNLCGRHWTDRLQEQTWLWAHHGRWENPIERCARGFAMEVSSIHSYDCCQVGTTAKRYHKGHSGNLEEGESPGKRGLSRSFCVPLASTSWVWQVQRKCTLWLGRMQLWPIEKDLSSTGGFVIAATTPGNDSRRDLSLVFDGMAFSKAAEKGSLIIGGRSTSASRYRSRADVSSSGMEWVLRLWCRPEGASKVSQKSSWNLGGWCKGTLWRTSKERSELCRWGT